jgi:hypothetical protein
MKTLYNHVITAYVIGLVILLTVCHYLFATVFENLSFFSESSSKTIHVSLFQRI